MYQNPTRHKLHPLLTQDSGSSREAVLGDFCSLTWPMPNRGGHEMTAGVERRVMLSRMTDCWLTDCTLHTLYHRRTEPDFPFLSEKTTTRYSLSLNAVARRRLRCAFCSFQLKKKLMKSSGIKKKITRDTSTCPEAVCLPHLAASVYTVRKMCSAAFRAQSTSVLSLTCLCLEVWCIIMHVKSGKVIMRNSRALIFETQRRGY